MLTRDDWKKIESEINIYSSLHLLIDKYKITIEMRFVSKTKSKYFMFVNGEFKGIWLNEDCDIRRKFMRTVTKRLYTKARVAKILQEIGVAKKSQASFIQKFHLDKTFNSYWWSWPSFSSLKNHLIKNNKEITRE